MRHIIIEGGDRLGKSTIIESLCKDASFDNVSVRHFGKPPKGLSPAEFNEFQFKAFIEEARLLYQIEMRSMGHSYYPETVIWNRAHLGEYVYSQMFRGGNPEKLKEAIINYENGYINAGYGRFNNTFLITLTADPIFFLDKEDGNSFSQTLEDKTKELRLFKEAHEFSVIHNKLLLKVDKEGKFRPKEEIFNQVLMFLKSKQ